MILKSHTMIVMSCLAIFLSTGCNVTRVTGHTTMNTPGALASQAIQSGGNSLVQTRQTKKSNSVRDSFREPIRVRPDLAREVDNLPGLKWTVVLVEGNDVYVGSYPQYSGNAPKGAAPRSDYNGPKLYDTKHELANQTPEQIAPYLNQVHPPADTFDSRPKYRSGYMSIYCQQQIRRLVTHHIPGVTHVYITTDIASAAILHGYAEFIQANGDMHPFLGDFQNRISQIWPNGHGTAANHPSASPNFGEIGQAAGSRTPAKEHIRVSPQP